MIGENTAPVIFGEMNFLLTSEIWVFVNHIKSEGITSFHGFHTLISWAIMRYGYRGLNYRDDDIFSIYRAALNDTTFLFAQHQEFFPSRLGPIRTIMHQLMDFAFHLHIWFFFILWASKLSFGIFKQSVGWENEKKIKNQSVFSPWRHPKAVGLVYLLFMSFLDIFCSF